jgi:predicted RNA-binding protein with TRAM domain
MVHAQLPDPCPSNQEPPADICESACIYCNFNGIMSSTQGYTGQTPPGGFCGTIENEQWLGFIAGATSGTFTATPTGCQTGNGVQIALYSACSSGFIACNGGSSGGGNTPVSVTATLNPGSNYFLLVDGFAGDQCSFTITVSPPAAAQAPPVGPTGPISGPLIVCPGATVTYSIPPVSGAGAYTWTAPPGSLIDGNGSPYTIVDPSGNSVQITFGPVGGQICVEPENSCDDGDIRCITVQVQPIPPTILDPVVVCANDVPYELPWGQFVNASGTYQTTLTSYLGCDSLVRQQVTVKPPLIINRPPVTVCAGDCITVFDEEFCDAGNYTITGESFQGCDSTINFSILVVNPIADILGGGVLSCANDTIVLSSAPSPGAKVWRSLPSNAVVGVGNSISVTQPGTYLLTVQASAGAKICLSTDTITITGNTIPPAITTMAGVLGCASPITTISASSPPDSIATFAWSGPGGFTSNISTPQVSLAGVYVVTVTSGVNGCTNTATAVVTGDTLRPVAGATGAELNCAIDSVVISGASNAQSSSWSWTGPGGFTSTQQNPLVGQPGTYDLVVTNTINGCTGVASAEVTLDDVPPGASASVSDVISCNDPSVILIGDSGGNGPTYAWAGPSGYQANEQSPTTDTAGLYILTVTGANGCTSQDSVTVIGDIIAPDVSAIGTTISCAVPSDEILGNSATPGATYAWSGPGGFVSSQQNPVVNAVGTYILTVSGPNFCTSTATADVDGNFTPPDAQASGGIITCGSSNTVISGSSSTPGATFSWAGPGGFSSNQQNPVVNQIGDYILTVQGPNGCTSTAIAEVVPDVNVPNATASGGTLTCAVITIVLNGGSQTPGVTFSWTGPGGFSSNETDPTVSVPGVYTLTVEDPSNGCTAQADATVLQNIVPPGVSASSGTLTCTSPSISVVGGSPTGGVNWSWTGPSGFNSNQQSPSVSEGGLYTLTVTGPNGCTSVATTTVLVDQTDPEVFLQVDTLTCSLTLTPIQSTVTLPSSYTWTGPGVFDSTNPNPNVSVPGLYTVTVTAANGCTDVGDIDVPQDIAPPDAGASGNTINCELPTVSISGTSVTPGVVYNWAGPSGFDSNQQNPSVSEGGTYTLTVTALNGCTSTATAEVLLDLEAPILSGAPDDILTCSVGSTTIQTEVSSPTSPIISLLWDGPGGFSSIDEDPVVTLPGEYTLFAISENGCISTLTVLVDQDIVPPNATASGATLTCSTTSITLEGGSTTPGANYSWSGPGGFSSSLEDPAASLDGTYILTVTGPNGCTSTATAIAAIDTVAPGVSALSTNDLDCNRLTADLIASSQASGATYVWRQPSGQIGTTPVVTISDPNTYTVVATGINGCTSQASLTVLQDINPPGASALGDTIDCITGNALLQGISPTAGSTWQWTGPNQFSSPLQNPIVTQDGTYTLVVTGPNGCTSTAQAVVIENRDSPEVQVQGAGTLTCIVTSLVLEGTINTPGATGVWTNQDNTVIGSGSSVTVTQPGVYTYTVTALNGCISAPQLTVLQNIAPPQDVVASGGLLNCTFPTITLTGSTSTNNVTFSWAGPGGFVSQDKNPSVSTPGVYTLTVQRNDNGCIATDTALVVQDPTIPDIVVATDVITCSRPTVVLNATTNTPNVTFSWTGPAGFTSTEEDPVVSVPGNYLVVATATSGCTSSFAIAVQEDRDPPGVTAQGVILTCFVPTANITASSPTPGVTYAWTGPVGFTSTDQNPLVSQTGDYTVVATAPNGCTSSATVAVLPDANKPVITATGGTITCALPSLALGATSNIANSTWGWTGPGGFSSPQQNPVVTAPGTYNLVVTAPNGCSSVATAVVLADVNGPVIQTAVPVDLTCTVTQVTLSASVQAPGNYTYAWTTTDGNILSGANTPGPIVSQAGIYTVVVTNLGNGCTSSADVEVFVDPSTPSGVNMTVRDVSCFGFTDGSVAINSVIGGTPPFRYSFDNRPFASNPLYTGLSPRGYTLVIEDANGCILETSLVIGEPGELIVELGPDTTIVYGDPLSLSLDDIVNFPDRVQTVRVNPPSLLDSVALGEFRPLTSFRYTVTVIDSNGCEAKDTRLVIVQKPRNVYVPNVFNPGASDGNDLFMIFGDDKVVEIRSFRVFDRWGGEVHSYFNFAPNDPASGWNGRFRGSEMNPGVFVWYAEIEFLDGEVILYEGDVTLVR